MKISIHKFKNNFLTTAEINILTDYLMKVCWYCDISITKNHQKTIYCFYNIETEYGIVDNITYYAGNIYFDIFDYGNTTIELNKEWSIVLLEKLL